MNVKEDRPNQLALCYTMAIDSFVWGSTVNLLIAFCYKGKLETNWIEDIAYNSGISWFV